ncbi:MAG: hypothetical protein V2A54_11735 [Bacteroidota bacterium]
MTKQTFKNNLLLATQYLIPYTREFVLNKLKSEDFFYTILSNSLEVDEHLNLEEREMLQKRCAELKKYMKIDCVVERLCINDKVPVWVNLSISRATRKHIYIELFISRRFRKDDYMYKNSPFTPFHITVAFPPRKVNDKSKFNLNWKNKNSLLRFCKYIISNVRAHLASIAQRV